jgi:hypothetical protein
MPIGATTTIDGIPMAHMGGGRFQPALTGESILKRFDGLAGEPLHRMVA